MERLILQFVYKHDRPSRTLADKSKVRRIEELILAYYKQIKPSIWYDLGIT